MTRGSPNPPTWAGGAISGLPALFLLADAGLKIARRPIVVQATVQLGYPESAIIGIGAVLLLSTVLYLIPRTAILGAVLLTGYLGGAVATHVRVSAVTFKIFSGTAWYVALGWPLAAGLPPSGLAASPYPTRLLRRLNGTRRLVKVISVFRDASG